MIEKNFQVYIISYKRAGGISSDGVFQDAYVVIPKSQEEEYRKYELKNNCEYLVIPDEADGNIVRKRNWILKNKKGNILIVDDDYKYVGVIEHMKIRQMSPEEIDIFIDRGFILCHDLGTKMWGINVNDDPKCYREYSPFSFLSPVLGPFQAFVNDGEFFYDERVYLKEDYDMSLQVLRKYHKILRINKYNYCVNHITQIGGCTSYRSISKEMEHNLRLQKKWGKKIVRLRENTINPIVNIPLKGI